MWLFGSNQNTIMRFLQCEGEYIFPLNNKIREKLTDAKAVLSSCVSFLIKY